MPKFRKKPIVIEAVRLTWENWNEVCEFVPKPTFIVGCYVDKEKDEETTDTTGRIGLWMKTQNTERYLAVEGDWICKGIEGEFYPCKNDIFEKTYEPLSFFESLPDRCVSAVVENTGTTGCLNMNMCKRCYKEVQSFSSSVAPISEYTIKSN